MKRYPDVCLQSLCRFGSLGLSKTILKELKQRRFVSFQTIPCSNDYASTKYLKDAQKNPISTYLSKTTVFLSLWPLNQLLNLELFNIHKMRLTNSHVVFSPKNNFQELQLHQTLIFFSEFWHMSRS